MVIPTMAACWSARPVVAWAGPRSESFFHPSPSVPAVPLGSPCRPVGPKDIVHTVPAGSRREPRLGLSFRAPRIFSSSAARLRLSLFSVHGFFSTLHSDTQRFLPRWDPLLLPRNPLGNAFPRNAGTVVRRTRRVTRDAIHTFVRS